MSAAWAVRATVARLMMQLLMRAVAKSENEPRFIATGAEIKRAETFHIRRLVWQTKQREKAVRTISMCSLINCTLDIRNSNISQLNKWHPAELQP